MNKEATIIGGAILGGSIENGIAAGAGEIAQNPIANIAEALLFGFLSTKVTGIDTKSNLLKGACYGAASVAAMRAIKTFSQKNLSSKLQGTGALAKFAKGAVGLGCACTEGLAGSFVGADGQLYNYDESGLSATFADEAGNIFESAGALNAAYTDQFGNVFDDGLNGSFVDENGNVFDDGLHGSADVYDDVNGLNGGEEFIYAESDTPGLRGEKDIYNELYNS